MSSRSPCRTSSGTSSCADQPQARICVGDERARDDRVVQPRHVADARERRLQDQLRRRMLMRELERDRGAERLAEVDDALRAGALEQRAARRAGVAVRARLRRATRAAPVAAVVEREHVEAGVRQVGDVRDAIADVAAVAVAQQHVPDRRFRRSHPPAVEPLAVVGLDRQVLVCARRRGRERAAREEQQRVEQAVGDSRGRQDQSPTPSPPTGSSAGGPSAAMRSRAAASSAGSSPRSRS